MKRKYIYRVTRLCCWSLFFATYPFVVHQQQQELFFILNTSLIKYINGILEIANDWNFNVIASLYSNITSDDFLNSFEQCAKFFTNWIIPSLPLLWKGGIFHYISHFTTYHFCVLVIILSSYMVWIRFQQRHETYWIIFMNVPLHTIK